MTSTSHLHTATSRSAAGNRQQHKPGTKQRSNAHSALFTCACTSAVATPLRAPTHVLCCASSIGTAEHAIHGSKCAKREQNAEQHSAAARRSLTCCMLSLPGCAHWPGSGCAAPLQVPTQAGTPGGCRTAVGGWTGVACRPASEHAREWVAGCMDDGITRTGTVGEHARACCLQDTSAAVCVGPGSVLADSLHTNLQ